MKENKQFKHYLSKAMFWCSKSEKSSGDVLKKLVEWDVSEEFHELILKQLRAENFVNDERFAIAFTNDKFKLSKWGRNKIKYALQSKQVDAEAIELALSQIDNKAYQKVALGLINSKIRQTKESDENKLKQKVMRFMASRGFEYGMVFDLWNKKE